MITLFNRKELTVTFDLNEQARLRKLLAEEGIDYSVKTVNRLSASPFSAGSRGRTGTYGQKTEGMIEYIIYVKRAEYDRSGVGVDSEIKEGGCVQEYLKRNHLLLIVLYIHPVGQPFVLSRRP